MKSDSLSILSACVRVCLCVSVCVLSFVRLFATPLPAIQLHIFLYSNSGYFE